MSGTPAGAMLHAHARADWRSHVCGLEARRRKAGAKATAHERVDWRAGWRDCMRAAWISGAPAQGPRGGDCMCSLVVCRTRLAWERQNLSGLSLAPAGAMTEQG